MGNFALSAAAQHHGGAAFIGGHGTVRGVFRPQKDFQNGLGGYGYGYGYGAGWSGLPDQGDMPLDTGFPAPVPPTPPVMALPPEPPPPPPPPARLVVHEYSWPAAERPSAATFALASKDGAVHFASAVWVQNGVLNYIDDHGSAGHMSIDSIDRENTRRLNAERALTLQIPVAR